MHHPPTNPAAFFAASLAVAAACSTGCVSTMLGQSDPAPPPVKPNDFVSEDRATSRSTNDGPVTLVATDTPDETGGTDGTPDPDRPTRALSVNAMVGHINGEAVYADQIFDVNVAAQLASYGRRYDNEEFLEQAAGVIQERLRGVIINKLILGEAERNLTDLQKRGISFRVNAEREELLRYYGQGSLAKAKADFLKDQGKSLDDHLIAFREELSIGIYIQSKVLPKISVNQRDVRRWYNDHKSQYHKPDLRSFRIIQVATKEQADYVQKRLKRGEAFDQVASDPSLNLYNPDGGGVFNSGDPLPGEKVHTIEPVNAALMPLDDGQQAGPVIAGEHYYFVQMIDFQPGIKIPLNEAQISIEESLKAAQFEKHALRFRMDLLKRGSYTKEEDMGAKLLEIAFARYDQ